MSDNPRTIRYQHEEERRQKLRSKRRTARKVLKAILCLGSVCVCAAIAVLGIMMRNELFNFDEAASLPVNNDQNIDEAQFESFGLYNEPAWRMFLLASLTLTFSFSLYIPIGIVFEQYHSLSVYNAGLFLMSVLTTGSQYFTVPYLAASITFLLQSCLLFFYLHILRLDLIEENRFWRQISLQHQQEDIEEKERIFSNSKRQKK